MPVETFVGRGAGVHIEGYFFRATQNIFVCSPWISLGYASKLIQIARKGVQVKVITSSDSINQSSVLALREALTPQKDFLGRVKKGWARPPLDMKVVDERFIHAKIYCFDGTYAVVGSANFTESGFFHNVEHIVIFKNPTDVERIEDDFGQLWLQYEDAQKVKTEKGIIRKLIGIVRVRP